MIKTALQRKLKDLFKALQSFADRTWYPAFVGFLAALDNFIIIIPTDAILISSSVLVPKRWLKLALFIAIGSTLGALSLAALVEYQGLPWLLKIYPQLTQSPAWLWSDEFFQRYGLLLIFAVSAAPLALQPAVILACLAHTPYLELGAVIFAGRFLKYAILAYVGARAPYLLTKPSTDNPPSV